MNAPRKQRAVRGSGHVVAALMVMAALPLVRVASYPFIRFDDYEYVVDNPLVSSGLSWSGIVTAFSSFHMGYWLPVTWISHMADVSLFGMNAGRHHLVNVLLHAVTTALLFLALQRLTGAFGRSALAAALFGVHPLRVESVAWIAERKDVLCALFFMLALLAWVRYACRPGAGSYLAALLAFSAGLLAKPMIVTLPVVLLMLDYWPLGRWARPGLSRQGEPGAVPWRGLVLEKVPFLLLSAGAAALTLYTQGQAGIMKGLEQFTPATRVANAVVAPVTYLGKTVWPASLAVFYPHPGPGLPSWKVAAAAVLLAAATGFVVRRAGTRPYLATGLAWYLVMLLPVLGLFQSGLQAVADRFTYLPHAGLFVAAVWLAAELVPRRRAPRRAAAALAGAALALLTARSFVLAGSWRDSVTLLTRALEVGGDSWITRTNLGVALLDDGQAGAAERSFDEALRLRPGYALALYNRGVALEAQGRPGEAIESYRAALRSVPDYAAAHLNLGSALGRAGRTGEAVGHFSEATRISPGSATAHFNLGLALELAGRDTEALDSFRAAARLQPGDVEAIGAAERLTRRLGNGAGDLSR